ncbi:hypothetical protein CsatB_002049 [Cannabis sativa]
MANHKVDRWFQIPTNEYSNSRNQSKDDEVFEENYDNKMIEDLKYFATLDLDLNSLENIIKIREVKAFKRVFLKIESKFYYKNLYENSQAWNDKIVKRGKVISLLNSISMIDLCNQEGRNIFNWFEQILIGLGSQLSEIIYFEDIVIVDKKGKKKVQHDVFYDENDDVFLDSIFDMIMLFVFFLFCPFFSFKLEIDDIIELGDFLVQMFEAKLWELIPLLIKDHRKFLNHSIQRDIEMKELIVQILDSKISELWC